MAAAALVVATLGVAAPAAAPASRPRDLVPELRRAKSITFVGHGDGAGIGMGQWGDFGYAVRYHTTYSSILSHYYGGTALTSLPALGSNANPTVTVVILENLDLATNVGYDPVVTSPSAFSVVSSSAAPTTTVPTTTAPATTTTTVPATTTTTVPVTTTAPPTTTTLTTTTDAATTTTTVPTTTVPTTTAPVTTAPVTTVPVTTTTATTVPAGSGFSVAGGQAVDLRLEANGTWDAYEGASCAAAQAATSGLPVATGLVDPQVVPSSTAPDAPLSSLLTLCRHDGVDEPLRGTVEAFDRSGYERTLDVLPMQSYLDGVVPAEESASWGLDGGSAGAPQDEAWGFQALEAQAVAARSYTLAYQAAGGWNGYADICDTEECEAYVGAAYEEPVSNAAVADTLGQVLVGTGTPATVVDARFSASTGGWTAPSTFPAVRDRGDACVVQGDPLECNPDHTWTERISAAAIHRKFPSVGTLESLKVSSRNDRGAFGGRAVDVVVIGSLGEQNVSGTAFASAVGLRSDWFAISHISRVKARTATTTST